MHVHLREPGREDEETIESGCRAAMTGGFTGVCSMPNTNPACDSQEVVRFIKKKAEDELVDVYPIASVTKNRKGTELTEMAELVKAGVVGFTDDGSPVANARIMRRALEYASMFDAVIIDHCEDMSLSEGGHMNESKMSTRLGITGIPNASEEIVIARDISLSRLTGARLHIAHISTLEGLELVRRAKDEGLPITCEVAPHHLIFTDEDLDRYDTHLKMNPPLRTARDVTALLQGLEDDTIDVIASDHAPHAVEEKDVEFDAAPFGITGLETMVGAILKEIVNKKRLGFEKALYKMSVAPRKILNIDIPEIKTGEMANFTIIDPDIQWIVDVNKHRSKSRNSPFQGRELLGQTLAVFNRNRFWTSKTSDEFTQNSF
jgi:dihydroorotase